jgi:hypothetical protein
MVTIESLDRSADEIECYVTRRYLSACQSYWRTAEFDNVKMEPPVTQMPIHLPGQQMWFTLQTELPLQKRWKGIAEQF